MKVGMIFECCDDGPDQKVCEYLAKRVLPNIEISSVALTNKPKLVRDCGVTSPNVYLIWEELEAWLIADGRALSTVLSTPAHPVKIKDEKKPESVKNPKGKLRKILLDHYQT